MADPSLRMLLVEDDEHDAELVVMMLKRSGNLSVNVDHVTSLSQAIDFCRRGQYDVVLLDLGLPDSRGTESVQRIKTYCPATPIVVLTGDDRDDTGIEAIDSGAQDFLPKQQLVGQLLTRIMQHSIARHNQLLQAQSDALIDGLTGIANRRACGIELDRCLSDFNRYKQPFCVALLDIDHFKGINDQWGHTIGDQVIQAVATCLVQTVRDSDHVSRYGGEEFAITFPRTRLPEAQRSAMRCIRDIASLNIGNLDTRVTLSAGLAEISNQEDGKSLFARADEALYKAKRAGRNRCIVMDRPALIDAPMLMQGSVPR